MGLGPCQGLWVRYGWASAKNAGNVVKHGMFFVAMEEFDWAAAFVRGDVRNSQTEVRLNAISPTNGRPFHVTYTIRRPLVWLISLRQASNKEIARYEADQA